MNTALLFDSSGLIGGHLLNKLIQNNDYNKIKIFVEWIMAALLVLTGISILSG